MMNVVYEEKRLSCDVYCNLRSSVGWLNFSKVQTQKALENSVYDIVAYNGDTAVGMGRIVGDGALYCYIQDVVVHPEYQGMGIGTNILNRCIDYVSQMVEEDGRISLGLVSVLGKESFYEQFGFKQLPHEFSGAGMRKVIYPASKK